MSCKQSGPITAISLLLHFAMYTTKEIIQQRSKNKITSKLRLPVYPQRQRGVEKAPPLWSSVFRNRLTILKNYDYGQNQGRYF